MIAMSKIVERYDLPCRRDRDLKKFIICSGLRNMQFYMRGKEL